MHANINEVISFQIAVFEDRHWLVKKMLISPLADHQGVNLSASHYKSH